MIVKIWQQIVINGLFIHYQECGLSLSWDCFDDAAHALQSPADNDTLLKLHQTWDSTPQQDNRDFSTKQAKKSHFNG